MSDDRLWKREPTAKRTRRTNESLASLIERTDDPLFDETRQHLELLWLAAPESERERYLDLLQSDRDSNFFSAYCELWFYEQLVRFGFHCRPAPETENGSKPDWIAVGPNGDLASVECYVRMPPDAEMRDELMSRVWFEGTLNKLRDSRVRIWIHNLDATRTMPSARKFAKFLDERAAGHPTGGEPVGKFEYIDKPSGWQVRFSLLVGPERTPDDFPPLVLSHGYGAEWCQGAAMFRDAIDSKAKQHRTTLPEVLAIGWAHFRHRPDRREVRDVVAERSASMASRGVYGVLWAENLYPWGTRDAGGPTLLHWNAPELAPFLDVWSGASVDVRD